MTIRRHFLKEFTFDSAHHLPNVSVGHKCRRLHGHTFRVQLHVGGPIDPHLGWVMDFGDIKNAFQPILDCLDHRYLNEIPGLDNPTSENLALYIWNRLDGTLPLTKVIIRETCTSGAVYLGPAEPN